MMEDTHSDVPQPIWKFLAGLQKMHLQVWNEDGRLRVGAPPGVLTPGLREELIARKAEVLDFLRETRGVNEHAPAGASAHRKVSRDQPLPLSFAQQRLLAQ